MTVRTGDTLYGVHENYFYAGKASPRKQYKVTQEMVTDIYGDEFRTTYYVDGFLKIGYYRTRDIGKTVFFGRGAAGLKRQELAAKWGTDETGGMR